MIHGVRADLIEVLELAPFFADRVGLALHGDEDFDECTFAAVAKV